MSPGDLLLLMVEASLGLAGFAGVVTALSKRNTRELSALYRMSLVNLLATSFGALFLSLVVLAMLSAGVEEASAWRFASAGGTLVTAYFGARSVQTLLAQLGRRHALRSPTVWAVNLPLLLVCALQLWNVVSLGEFWPVVSLLIAWFGLGCFSFVRLLFDPAE